MNTIKFRGRRIDNGEWVYGNLAINSSTTECCEIFTWSDTKWWFYTVHPKTIGQFVGIKNKNNVEIYVGDQLEDPEDEGYFVVRYCDKTARFVLDLYGVKGQLTESGFDEDAGPFGIVDTLCFDDFCNREYFNIIGTIHDKEEFK